MFVENLKKDLTMFSVRCQLNRKKPPKLYDLYTDETFEDKQRERG